MCDVWLKALEKVFKEHNKQQEEFSLYTRMYPNFLTFYNQFNFGDMRENNPDFCIKLTLEYCKFYEEYEMKGKIYGITFNQYLEFHFKTRKQKLKKNKYDYYSDDDSGADWFYKYKECLKNPYCNF